MNIIERVFKEIAEDSNSGSDADAERIREAYKAASEEGKRRINDIFIALCGWSMETLIAMDENGTSS